MTVDDRVLNAIRSRRRISLISTLQIAMRAECDQRTVKRAVKRLVARGRLRIFRPYPGVPYLYEVLDELPPSA